MRSIACWPKRSAPASRCRRSISPRWTATPSPRARSTGSRPNSLSSSRIAAGSRVAVVARRGGRADIHGRAIPRGRRHRRDAGTCPASRRYASVVDGPVRQGSNIRRAAKTSPKARRLLQVGQRLDARHLALLAAQGIRKHPGIVTGRESSVASTGDELRQPAETLGEAADFRLESADAAGSRASSGFRRDRRRVYPRRRRGNGPPSLRPRRHLRHGRHDRRRFRRRGGPFGGGARSERSLLRGSQNCPEARKASGGRALPARRLFGSSRQSRFGFGRLVYRRWRDGCRAWRNKPP